MRGIIEQLLPGVHVVTRPRMSVLSYSGQKKLTRLPERSAIVAFSADEVYAVGELIRRQRGGAAVVLGALSPRTRNKQVEIFQSGDVDFLVATDAIGMGLNLDLDHVAFASNRKYDGYQFRELSAAELGQIAGRAGRHMRDGTFGVTGRVDPFPDPLVEALETHRFEPVRTIQWRNDSLDFSSIAALKASLEESPQVEGLTRAQPADDQQALETLARDEDVASQVRSPEQVRRLWDVAQLPDYRKISPQQHADLVGTIYRFVRDGGVVPEDWIAEQIRQAKHTDGDIDTLSARIAHIRTWAFVANQADWLAEPPTWREEAKAVEDKLSDALHERLTKRFVDRRTSVLMRRMRENTVLEADITPAGEVRVEGHQVGMLQGFRFTPDLQAGGAEAQTLRGAAQKALAAAITDRATRLSRAADGEIVLSVDGHVRWQGEPVARLVAGEDILKPRVLVLADDQLTGAPREMVETRLNAWLTSHIGTLLKPLIELAADQALAGMARGIAFQLVENLGILERRQVLSEVRGLDQDARAGLRRHGVRFGAYHIYVPALLKPGPSALIAQLWALKHKSLDMPGLAELSSASVSGRTSTAVDAAFDPELYRRFGFRIYGSRAIRIDILERVADLIRPALAWTGGPSGERPPGALDGRRGFAVTPAMTSLLGASGEDMSAILKALGYRMELRPKPVETLPAALDGAAVPAGTADPSLSESDEPKPDPQPGGDPDVVPPVEEPPVVEPDVEPPMKEPPQPEPPAEIPPSEPPAEVPPGQPPLEEPPVQEPTVASAANAEAPAEADLEKAEPAVPMIEVWMPAPPRPKRPPRKHSTEGDGRQGRQERDGRPPRRADKRRTGGEKTPRRDRGDRGERERTERPQWQQRPRERAADPDSPFAALAALKKDLEKSERE
jgi:ATP-dependent RNA helicase SUPV3L1/SUV3